jgi:hypothetical protein
MKRLGLFFGIVFLLSASCSDDTCTESIDTRMLVKITAPDPNLSEEDMTAQLVINHPQWADSLHFAQEHTEQVVRLGLNPAKDTTSFVLFLKNDELIKDTLTLTYSRSARYISQACGFVQEFSNLKGMHTVHSIDSVKLFNTKITTLDESIHLAIYY